MAILKELGIRIASLRLQKNLRQIDVSEQSGLSLDTVKRLEKGQGKLSSLVSVLRARLCNESVANTIGIKGAHAMIEQVLETASKWSLFAKHAGVLSEHVDEVQQYLRIDLE